MNKKLLAFAVAGAMAAPVVANAAAHGGMSGPTVYGSARIELNTCDLCNDGPTDAWILQNTGSRLGVKGAEDLGGGLSAIYQYEFGVDIADSGFDPGNRPKYIGLKGDFGQLTLGRQFQITYLFGESLTDIFNDGANALPDVGTRASNIAEYQNSFGAVTLGLGLVFDGADAPAGEDMDSIQIGVKFNAGPVDVWLANNTQEDNAGGVGDATIIGIKWDFGQGDVRFGMTTEAQTATTDQETMRLVGQFKTGNEIFLAGYSQRELDGSTAEPTQFRLEWQHNFSKRTRFWAAWIDNDNDNGVSDEEAKINLGLRHDF